MNNQSYFDRYRGRSHHSMIKIIPMTREDYENQPVSYSCFATPCGNIMIASTSKGICYLGFSDTNNRALQDLQQRFPKVSLCNTITRKQEDAIRFFTDDWNRLDPIILHVKGTSFQLNVWEELLKIPIGNLVTYQDIAQKVEKSKAFRAVGSAIGKNPVSILIPCHRVICSSGKLGGFYWGINQKISLLQNEKALIL
ncbi:MAG: methylated-DNA--[protein]-cysteine S-methyltransferase [Bacteroidales bacterium]